MNGYGFLSVVVVSYFVFMGVAVYSGTNSCESTSNIPLEGPVFHFESFYSESSSTV